MTLFLIPARAGSKRLVNKNVLLFCGAPLYRWSLMTALRIRKPQDAVLVSTDIDELLQTEKYATARPDCLCRDDSTTQTLIDWTFEQNPATDSICLLQPTSPGRSDDLVRSMVRSPSTQSRSVTNGAPNGQCYIYVRGATAWLDIETEKGFDVDTQEDFDAAERDMLRRFA